MTLSVRSVRVARAAALFAILALLTTAPTYAADREDHPMISRYEGSTIEGHRQQAFEEYDLLQSQAIFKPYPRASAKTVQSLEGRITQITYKNPAGRSPLEVFRNYETELGAAGFEILFQCKTGTCGGRAMNFKMTEATAYVQMGDSLSGHRYLAAKKTRDEGDVYVALYTTRAGGNRTWTRLDVIEVAPMQTQMVTITADAMAKSILADGTVSIYGILFDTDSSTIKPESAETLREIASLLTSQPSFKLYVVGHTDHQGALAYNLTLSEARAKAVVDALVADHGIAKARLTAKGLAFLAPASTNRTEPGRALNRRVELVERLD